MRLNFYQEGFGHSIQRGLVAFPVRHEPVHKLPECQSMVVFLQTALFMHDHIIDAVPWCLHQMGIEGNHPTGRTVSPLHTRDLKFQGGFCIVHNVAGNMASNCR